MRTYAVIGALVGLAFSSTAFAQTCASYPYTLTNGATADANQVMANFNCAARTYSPSFTGKVGIGTTSPSTTLDVESPSGANLVLFRAGSGQNSFLSIAGNGNALLSTSFDLIQDSNNNASVFNRANGNILFGTNNLERARIAPSGYFGIGTANPEFQLSVAGQYTQIGAGRSTASDWVNLVFGDTTGSYQQIAFDPSSQQFSITAGIQVNGNAGGTSNWIVYSDERLKKNIQPLNIGIAAIKNLRPVRFQWRSTAERPIGKDLGLDLGASQVGFIAQEVAAVVPEAVTIPAAGSNQPYGLREDNLIPVLVAAIKEQEAKIEALEAAVAALKGN